MRLLDILPRKKSDASRGVFSSLFNQAAPDRRGADFLDAYTGWVYAATDRIAQACADVDLRLERKSGKTWEEVDSHLALDTLRDANPLDVEAHLSVATFTYLSLLGESIWFVVNGAATKKPKELYPLDPTRVKVAKSSIGQISGYVYRNDAGKDVPLKAEEVIFFRRFNPRNRYRGMGPLQAAAVAVDTDTYAGRWNRNFFFNSATVSSVLETDGTITDEQYQRLRAQWDENYKGVDNSHKTAILEAGLKYKPVGVTQKDMEFLESRKFNRDEILAIFGVPKSLLSITDDVNLANAQVHERVFAANTVRPYMKFYTQCLTEFYLPLFGLERNKWRMSFTDPVPADFDQELKRKQTGIASGWYTINEVREEEGLEAVEGGDVPLISATMRPLVESTDANDNDDDNQDEPDNTPPAKAVQKSQPVEVRIRELNQAVETIESSSLSVFADQAKAIVQKLTDTTTKADTPDEPTPERDELIDRVFDNFDAWDLTLAAAIRETINHIYTFGGQRTSASIAISTVFDLANPRAVSFLENHALEAAKQVNSTMRDEIKRRLIDGVERGDSIQDIADSIKTFYDDQSEWRALRLARTEVKTAYAQGSLEGARQSGMHEKRWITSGLGEFDICRVNESQGWIPVEEEFTSGHLVDPSHPNCQCAVAYRALE